MWVNMPQAYIKNYNMIKKKKQKQNITKAYALVDFDETIGRSSSMFMHP